MRKLLFTLAMLCSFAFAKANEVSSINATEIVMLPNTEESEVRTITSESTVLQKTEAILIDTDQSLVSDFCFQGVICGQSIGYCGTSAEDLAAVIAFYIRPLSEINF